MKLSDQLLLQNTFGIKTFDKDIAKLGQASARLYNIQAYSQFFQPPDFGMGGGHIRWHKGKISWSSLFYDYD